jgi:hypothetical protein
MAIQTLLNCIVWLAKLSIVRGEDFKKHSGRNNGMYFSVLQTRFADNSAGTFKGSVGKQDSKNSI